MATHNGLWRTEDATKHDFLARLAIAPLVVEARRFDVPPTMIDRLKLVGDEEAANALCIVMSNEITHVSLGKRWFECMSA